jgi:hypothetical protein
MRIESESLRYRTVICLALLVRAPGVIGELAIDMGGGCKKRPLIIMRRHFSVDRAAMLGTTLGRRNREFSSGIATASQQPLIRASRKRACRAPPNRCH